MANTLKSSYAKKTAAFKSGSSKSLPPRSAPQSREKIEKTIIDEIEAMFLTYFKTKAPVAGSTMSKEDVISHVLKKLDQKQDKQFEQAMNKLVKNGKVEVQADGVTLTLTQLGASSL